MNKMPEFYTIFARKNTFCPNFGWGQLRERGNCPLPPSPTPMTRLLLSKPFNKQSCVCVLFNLSLNL